MSLDSIVHITIDTKNLPMAQAGFGIPFTDKGLDLVRSEILAQLSDGVNRGFLAQDPKPQVYIPPLSEINAEMREKRILPDVTFSARAAGAIHEIEIRGTITF